MYEVDRNEELDILVRAKYALIYILSWEEQRVEKILQQMTERRRKNLYSWTLTDGIVSMDGDDGLPVDHTSGRGRTRGLGPGSHTSGRHPERHTS